MTPYLYVDNFGAAHPVVFSMSRDQFVWEPALQRHVARFPVEEFEANAKRILNEERGWRIHTGIEFDEVKILPTINGEDLGLAAARFLAEAESHDQLEELELRLAAALTIAEGNEVILEKCDDFIRNCPTVQAVAALRAKLALVSFTDKLAGDSARPETEPKPKKRGR
jgi:hypothetical protein